MHTPKRLTRADFQPGHVPFDGSGLPREEGEMARAYEWRCHGYVSPAVIMRDENGAPSGDSGFMLSREPGETWAAYMARAGAPLTGKALAMATDGAEVGEEAYEAFWAGDGEPGGFVADIGIVDVTII